MIDTDTDEIVRRIVFREKDSEYGYADYAVKAGSKIAVLESGSPIREPNYIYIVYPEQVKCKVIELEEVNPYYMVYSPYSKLLVQHGLGSYPSSVIDMEHDRLYKTFFLENFFYPKGGVGGDGRFYGQYATSFFAPYHIASLDIETRKITILGSNLSAGGGNSGWSDHEYLALVWASNFLYVPVHDSKQIRVYDTTTGKLSYSIEPTNSKGEELFPQGAVYYSPSNWLIVGGDEGKVNSCIGIIDLNTTNMVGYITNYKARFKVNNHKVYVLDSGARVIAVFSLTNGLKLVKKIPY
ncbi:YncE family protein [Thermospira aquatica]|uniref:Uncharacterized protein n=1 Tax=Thermospira aquatica TaxID=2828656 RepID=A0AAX3BDG5_9SPIR|nr:hypothetical protein [Thermospira aquatica]URA10158.1 hypothetical protein KDW03_11870 [Thermospira aquatica]